jgi:hypothetical protein
MSVPFDLIYAATCLPTGERAFHAHEAAWAGHVAAGRIGGGTKLDPEALARLRASEMALLGHAPSFPDPLPASRKQSRGA